jgi:hypothetical protein
MGLSEGRGFVERRAGPLKNDSQVTNPYFIVAIGKLRVDHAIHSHFL